MEPKPARRGLAATTTSSNIFVVSWGCLVDTVPWRTQLAMEAASRVWPDSIPSYLCGEYGDENSWLYNKMAAVSYFLSGTEDSCSVSVDFCLALRLLIEEQQLDLGESNGKSGKYASKFHPRGDVPASSPTDPQVQQSDGTIEARQKGRSSRPLTVGEITANWGQGGMLREAVRMKYHCSYQDPVPILQETIDTILNDEIVTQRIPSPTAVNSVQEQLHTILDSNENFLVVTVNHPSEIPLATEALKSVDVSCNTVPISDALFLDSSVAYIQRGNSASVQQLVDHAPLNSTIFVVDDCWDSLQTNIALYGDHMPRVNAIGKCFAEKRFLSLGLASWVSHPTQHGAATMNPWTRSLDWNEFSTIIQNNVDVQRYD